MLQESKMATSEQQGFSSRLQLQPYQIAIIVIVVTVLLGVAWWYLLFQPTRENISELKNEIQTLEGKIAEAKRVERRLPELREEVEKLNGEREEFLSELPKENEIAQLIDRLRISASNANVILNQISNNGISRQSVANVRPFSFSVATEGTYFDTLGFLEEIESFKRFTRIRQVDFSIQGNQNDDPLLNTNYNFTVYTFTGSDPGPSRETQ